MRVTVVTVGRMKAGPLADAVAEFEKRAARYWKLDTVVVREEPARSSAPAVVTRREADRIADVLGSTSFTACAEEGDALSSTQFAKWLERARDTGRDVTFVIGGAFGLDASLRARAERRLSLAPWTLSHELARLVLAEQLYRAGTILRGEPYHK